MNWRNSSACFILALLICAMAVSLGEAYGNRKPPFNGSIFGKRARASSGSSSEMDNSPSSSIDVKLAVCEVAWETCSHWFPAGDLTRRK